MIHASALSMPGTKRRRSEQTPVDRFSRSLSQPGNEFHSSSLPVQKLAGKFFLENLLSGSKTRFGTNSISTVSRLKIASSSASFPQTDRSTKVRSEQASSSIYDPSSTNVRANPTELTLKFRRAGNLILFARFWCRIGREKNASRSEQFRSYLQVRERTDKFIFDKTKFKVQPPEILFETKKFFSEPIGSRDVDQFGLIRKSLAEIKPFTRLPIVLQNKFLQQAWYECHPPGRTILRQGLNTSCFYIILSGSAIPTYKRSAQEAAETLEFLKTGSTFGEQAIINETTQAFTVTAETTVELVVLCKDDFKSIFLANDRHCSKEDLYFLKNNVPLLNGFPIDQLKSTNDGIQNCHFRASEVLVRDSRRMKHIYVVKKGSLSIWKRLDTNGDRSTASRFSGAEKNDEQGSEDEATGDDRVLFSEIKLNDAVNKSIFNAAKLDADVRLSRLRRSNLNEQRISSATSSSTQTALDGAQKVFPGLIDKRDRLQTVDYDSIAASINRKTLAAVTNDLRKDIVRSKPKILTPKKSLFVHVKTLNEGQHFGLADLLFPNQPVLTLVSNECECILLHKASFIEIATDQYKQNLRRTEIPFPTDGNFYKTFHNDETWKRLTKKVYLDAFPRAQMRIPPSQRRSQKIHQQNLEFL